MAGELEKWLRKEAAERIAAAKSRRGYAQAGANLTDEDLEAAHVLTEKMLGRKIPKTTRAEDKKSAEIQEKIADRLEREAATILGFADFVAEQSRASMGAAR